jgi:biopolymer transport protein ExbB
MSTLFEAAAKGGAMMIPMAALSVATLTSTIDRAIFWFGLFRSEDQVAHRILEAARYSLTDANQLAKEAGGQPIARFMQASLKLVNPSPDSFRLAMETASEHEFEKMTKGNKLLETAVALAPLIGLLGTVTGLMRTFENLNMGVSGSVDTGKAAEGIGEALTATAAGMVVAIIAMVVLRVCVSLESQQLSYFARIGGELELIYRQIWYEPRLEEQSRARASLERRYYGEEERSVNRRSQYENEQIQYENIEDSSVV